MNVIEKNHVSIRALTLNEICGVCGGNNQNPFPPDEEILPFIEFIGIPMEAGEIYQQWLIDNDLVDEFYTWFA